jgi:peptidoglycan/LPS O-acetylase OafA/YrhL
VACAAVRRLRPTDRGRRIAGYLALLLVAAIVGILYLLDAFPITGVYDSAGVVDLLFVPLVITLAIGAGSLPRLLSTRLMVYAGEISFCLYMVHELVHTSWTWAVINFQLHPWEQDNPWRWNIFGLLAIAVGLSILLYHFVEEPARRWMRRMVDAPPTPAGHEPEESASTGPHDPADTELQQIDDALSAVPARAV